MVPMLWFSVKQDIFLMIRSYTSAGFYVTLCGRPGIMASYVAKVFNNYRSTSKQRPSSLCLTYIIAYRNSNNTCKVFSRNWAESENGRP